MFGVIMPLCNRMFCCIFGWYFFIKIRLKYEKNILLSSSRAFLLSTPMENSAVCQLQSFFIVYPCGQWGYMEKRYKMQQSKLATLPKFLLLSGRRSNHCPAHFLRMTSLTLCYSLKRYKSRMIKTSLDFLPACQINWIISLKIFAFIKSCQNV